MKRFVLLALVVSVLGCKKSTDAGGGSASAGSSVVGSAATGSAMGSAAGSASAFDDKLELPKQPARPKDEQARVDAAADALRTALTGAKNAADSAALCKLFDPLGSAMNKLQQVSAPKGVDAQMFSSQRDAVIQLFDGASNFCDNPANVGVDTLQALMGDVRKHFIALVGLGAK